MAPMIYRYADKMNMKLHVLYQHFQSAKYYFNLFDIIFNLLANITAIINKVYNFKIVTKFYKLKGRIHLSKNMIHI